MKSEHLAIMIKGRCPKCEHENTSNDLLHGNPPDHIHFTVICIKCKNRFIAHLEVEGSNPKNLLYLAQEELFQTIHNTLLQHKRQLVGETFLKIKYPHLFWNLLHHYSTYRYGISRFRRWRIRHIEKLYGCKVKY
jgi:Holliday junction resolvase